MVDHLCALTEPSLRLPVEKHDRVLAGCQDDIEVAAIDRLLRPPAVDDAPLLTHQRDLLPVHGAWRTVEVRLHESPLGRVKAACRRGHRLSHPGLAAAPAEATGRAAQVGATFNGGASATSAARPLGGIASDATVQSSRGTSSALCSGIRDQGATSTTEHTAPEPAPARTCFKPSLR